MGAGFHGGFGGTKGAQDNTTVELIAELEKSGVKFTKEDVVFITKDHTGQTIWLERGNASAGLEHILSGDGKSPGHVAHFEQAFGIPKEQIPAFIKEVVTNGKVISNSIKVMNGREGYERIYYYDGRHYLLTGIGTNGFIVTAFPIKY